VAWLSIDVAVAVLGLLVLGGLALRLWRQVRRLSREVGAAGERVARAAAELEELAKAGSAVGPLPDGRSGVA